MELGKLQFDWEQSSETIALVSFGGNTEESFSLLNRLVDEASANYPQLSQLRFVRIPLPVSTLDKWSYWLAAQVVEQCRDRPVEECSVATTIDKLGLSSAESRNPLLDALDNTATDASLTLQLAVRFESLRKRQRQQKLTPSQWQQWLDREATELSEWFTQSPPLSRSSQSPIEASGCLAQLHTNVLALRSNALRQLQGCFVRQEQAGPRALLTFLGSLVESLERIHADYEAQRQDRLRRESSAWRAYYNLREALEERKWRWSGQVHMDCEAALRALTTVYEFKLGAEIYTQAAQLVGELVQQTRLYAASVVQVDAMLASLQDWFTERGLVQPLFIPLLKDSLAEQVNLAQLRSELESWVGCTLQQWGALEPTQREKLLEYIVARTRPLCLEVYTECCRYILNLDTPDRQTQQVRTAQSPAEAKLATMPHNSEKQVKLHVRDAEIRDVLALLGQASGEKVIADESISGTVSLTLNDSSVTEAMKALMVAGNLTYTKRGDVYTFSQLPMVDFPRAAIPELNGAKSASC